VRILGRALGIEGIGDEAAMMARGNLFEGAEAPESDGESFEELMRSGGVRIERIVSHGHSSKAGFWYEQEEAEWVLVVSGRARLRLLDPEVAIELGPGDWLFIPPLRRHRVEWTTPDQPTVWVAVWSTVFDSTEPF